MMATGFGFTTVIPVRVLNSDFYPTTHTSDIYDVNPEFGLNN